MEAKTTLFSTIGLYLQPLQASIKRVFPPPLQALPSKTSTESRTPSC